VWATDPLVSVMVTEMSRVLAGMDSVSRGFSDSEIEPVTSA